MKKSILFKFLSSLPIILIVLYFIPFLGICLILFRYFINNNKKNNSTSILLVGFGLLILIPKLLDFVLNVMEFKLTIPYLNDIVNLKIYNNSFIEYSKFLITVGVIFLILSFVLEKIFYKIGNWIRNYISELRRKDEEISRKNDMEIKIKQEKVRNTSYVKCPSCGADNLISEKFDTCKYCRKKLENKNFK